MTRRQRIELIDALVDFCTRVAKGNATSEREIEALPKVAEILIELPTIRPDTEN